MTSVRHSSLSGLNYRSSDRGSLPGDMGQALVAKGFTEDTWTYITDLHPAGRQQAAIGVMSFEPSLPAEGRKNGKGKPIPRSLRLNRLARYLLADMDPERNCYVSVNRYKGLRSNANVVEIGALHLDLDFYAEGSKWAGRVGEAPQRLVESVHALCEMEGIPSPSLITYSHGLQMLWLLERPVPVSVLPRWKLMEASLIEHFKDYGADAHAKDPARIFRLPGTRNSKNGQICRIVDRPVDENGEVIRYNFEYLAECLLPAARWTCEEHKKRSSTRATFRNGRHLIRSNGQMAQAFVGKTFYAHSAADIRKLIGLRGGIREGGRMTTLWLLATTSLHAGLTTPEMLYEDAAEWMKLIDPSWKTSPETLKTIHDKCLRNLAGESVEFNGKKYPPLYTPSRAYMVEALNITEEEQLQLSTLCMPGLSRRECRNAKRRKTKERTREAISQEKATRRGEALRLRKEGQSVKEIANAMKVTEGTVYKYLRGANAPVMGTAASKTVSGDRSGYVNRRLMAQTLLGLGVSVQEIAKTMGVSDRTVCRYRRAEPSRNLSDRSFYCGGATGALALADSIEEKKEDLLVAPPSMEKAEDLSEEWTSEEVWHASAASLDDELPTVTESTPPADDGLPPLESYDDEKQGPFGLRRFTARELETVRRMSFEQLMERIDAKWSENALFMPRNDAKSKAYDVQTPAGDLYRVVMTGMKFTSYTLDGRIAKQGGGAIDLAQHLLHKEFIPAMYALLGRDKDEEDEELRTRWGRSAREAYADLQKSRGGDVRIPAEQSLFDDSDLQAVPRLAEAAEDYKAGMDDIPF